MRVVTIYNPNPTQSPPPTHASPPLLICVRSPSIYLLCSISFFLPHNFRSGIVVLHDFDRIPAQTESPMDPPAPSPRSCTDGGAKALARPRAREATRAARPNHSVCKATALEQHRGMLMLPDGTRFGGLARVLSCLLVISTRS